MKAMCVSQNEARTPPSKLPMVLDNPKTMPKAANITALQTLSRASGGKFCEINELNPTLSALHFEQSEEQRVFYRTLWNNWVILAALVGLLVLEWALRRWRNLA